ncbi:MAG: hypothetical protein WC378_19420 [Opitutaceae bacterium]|jgi:hypothetical protein
MEIEYPEDRVKPGDILAFDFEILTEQPTLKAWVISEIKKTLWAYPLFDFQSAKEMVVGDQELKKDVTILRVWVSVRETAKEPRVTVQEASLAWFVAGVATATVALVTYAAMTRGAKQTGVGIVEQFADLTEETGEVIQETSKLFAFGILGLVAYALLLKQ